MEVLLMAKRKSSSRTFKKDYEKQLNYIDHNRKRFTVDQEKQIRTGGKIKPSDVIRILSTKTDGTLDDILWDYNADYSVPSFTAQRDRLDISAITNLITWTYKNGSQNKTWSGYHIFAGDGSDVTAEASKMPEKYIYSTKTGDKYVLMHVNTLYDVMNNLYVASSVVPKRKEGEIAQMKKIVATTQFPQNSIIVLDRGFCSVGLIYDCIQNGVDICVRMRLRWLDCINNLPNEEIDQVKDYTFTTHQNKQTMNLKKEGKISFVHQSDVSFTDTVTFTLRVVKFQLDNGDWETLVTTITDQKRFPLDKMKALYKLRWSVETSYRFLKYRIGMIKLHARKLNAVTLELYAKILGFNLCFAIINMADINWHESKYKLKINISKALHRVLSFFREKEWPLVFFRYLCHLKMTKP